MAAPNAAVVDMDVGDGGNVGGDRAPAPAPTAAPRPAAGPPGAGTSVYKTPAAWFRSSHHQPEMVLAAVAKAYADLVGRSMSSRAACVEGGVDKNNHMRVLKLAEDLVNELTRPLQFSLPALRLCDSGRGAPGGRRAGRQARTTRWRPAPAR